MSKTSVSTILTAIKRRVDYNITDSSLDNLLIDIINDAIRTVRQWLLDYGRDIDITGVYTLLPITGQQYKQLNKATIIGDVATFTGVAGDKINVTVDGTTYTVSINTCTTIALVVAAINTAVGSTVASESSDGFLRIDSLTTGSTSSVTIADGTGGNTGEADRLFSTDVAKTDTAIADFDNHLALRDEVDGRVINYLSPREFFENYPDYSEQEAGTADFFTIWNGRIYFGPTPSYVRAYYLEYFKLPTVVTSASTMPFEDIYDPLVLSIARMEFLRFMDAKDTVSISSAEKAVAFYRDSLIVGAAKNIAQENGSQSRRSGEDYGPRIALKMS